MDLTPKSIEENKEIAKAGPLLNTALIVYTIELLEQFSRKQQTFIFDKVRTLSQEALEVEVRYGIPIPAAHGDVFYEIVVGLIPQEEILTARIWEMNELDIDQFLFYVKHKKALL